MEVDENLTRRWYPNREGNEVIGSKTETIYGMRLPDRGDDKCRGTQAEACMGCSKNSIAAGSERVRRRVRRDEVREEVARQSSIAKICSLHCDA